METLVKMPNLHKAYAVHMQSNFTYKTYWGGFNSKLPDTLPLFYCNYRFICNTFSKEDNLLHKENKSHQGTVVVSQMQCNVKY